MHYSWRLIIQTLGFSRSYLHRQVSPPETLVVKGRTIWARNGRWILPENARLPRNIQGPFTCRKSFVVYCLLYDNYNTVELFFSIPEVFVFPVGSQWIDFDRLCYQSYVTGSLPQYVLFNFINCWKHEFVKWKPLVTKMRGKSYQT